MHSDQVRSDDGEARELLRLAQARFSNLIRSLPVGIAIVRADGVIEAANPCVLNLFGYDVRELVNQSLQMLLVKAPWQQELPAWYQLNPESTIELEGKVKGGERVRIDLSIRMLDADAHGRYVVVIQDVARRFLAEQLKQQFYRMINHDIKSPLAAVSLFLEALAESDPNATLTDFGSDRLTASRDNLARVVALVQGLLELDRLESGSYNLKIEPVDVQQLVDQALAGTRELAAHRGISISSKTENVLLEGDFGRLLEVVVNLLSNAIEHSTGGTTIELTALRIEKRFRLSVQDHGRGVPDSEKQQIFDQFQQASTHKSGGHGLGLFICREIIQKHGGIIGCQDGLAGGAIFWFELPLTAQAGSQRP